jgi:transcription-repair coupling factor (superfamily II helicase)
MCADSAGRRETLLQLFAESGLRPMIVDDFAAFLAGDSHFSIAVAPLQTGFALPSAQMAFVTEAELYAGTARRAGRRKQEQASTVDAMVRDLAELKIGDPVVHSEHGIGRYQGLVTLDMGQGDEEFLHLDYDKAASSMCRCISCT